MTERLGRAAHHRRSKATTCGCAPRLARGRTLSFGQPVFAGFARSPLRGVSGCPCLTSCARHPIRFLPRISLPGFESRQELAPAMKPLSRPLACFFGEGRFACVRDPFGARNSADGTAGDAAACRSGKTRNNTRGARNLAARSAYKRKDKDMRHVTIIAAALQDIVTQRRAR
jgi:hypothetical protein